MKAIASRFPIRPMIAVIAVFAVFSGLIGLVALPGGGSAGDGTLFASNARAEDETHAAPAEEPVANETSRSEAQPAVRQTASIFQDDPVARLAQSLQMRQDELTARENELEEQERRLNFLREQIEGRIRELRNLREEMQTDIQSFETRLAAEEERRDAARIKEVKKWVEIYEQMRPEGAAPVLSGLDDELAVQVLSNMEPKKAGKILDQMDPQRAIDLGAQL